MKHRTIGLLAVMGLLLAIMVFPASAAPPGQAAITTITIHDGTFDPAVLTVPAGTTVTWQNAGVDTHELVSVDGAWAPVTLPPGVSYTRVFEEVGTFLYLSAGRGEVDGSGMTGSIVVEPAAATDEEPDSPAEPTEAPGGSGGIQDVAQLVMLDQDSDGNTVMVYEVFATEPSYVAIHPQGSDGNVDIFTTLGSTRVEAGSHASLPIFLDTPLTSNATLYATLHQDVGEPEIFEYPGPDEPIEVDGEDVTVPFFVTLTGVVDTEPTPEPTPIPEATPQSVPTTGGGNSVGWVAAVLGLAMLGSGWVLRRELAKSRQE